MLHGPYGDSDLLVAPESYGPAEEILRELGFRPLGVSLAVGISDLGASLRPGSRRPPLLAGGCSCGAGDGLGGADRGRRDVADRRSRRRGARHPGKSAADCPSPGSARGGGQPLEDLARALRIADEQVWYEAGDLARRVDAPAAFATTLRLDPEGALLAQRLTLPAKSPPEVALRARFVVPCSSRSAACVCRLSCVPSIRIGRPPTARRSGAA